METNKTPNRPRAKRTKTIVLKGFTCVPTDEIEGNIRRALWMTTTRFVPRDRYKTLTIRIDERRK